MGKPDDEERQRLNDSLFWEGVVVVVVLLVIGLGFLIYAFTRTPGS